MEITNWSLWTLKLHDLRNSGNGTPIPVAVFDSIEKLLTWYGLQQEEWEDVPSPDFYGDVKFYKKSFRKGSPLEWFAPSNSVETEDETGGVEHSAVQVDPRTIDFDVPFNPVYKKLEVHRVN